MTGNWIWEKQGWPEFEWQEQYFSAKLKHLYFLSGQIHSLNALLSERDRIQFTFNNLLQSIDKQRRPLQLQLSASIREQLELPVDDEAVQSAYSRRWAEAILDSCHKSDEPFSLERLMQWHQSIQKEESNQLRQGKDSDGTEKVLFELIDLTEWFNSWNKEHYDPMIRVAVSCLRLACIKPFNTYNIDICRMIGNLALNQSVDLNIPIYLNPHLFSESNDIFMEELNSARRGSTDITNWIDYFLDIINECFSTCLEALYTNLNQPKFWAKVAEAGLNSTQAEILRDLFNNTDPEASINASEYQQLTGVSKASATRHLTEMHSKGCIKKLGAGGRSTRYKLNISLEGVA